MCKKIKKIGIEFPTGLGYYKVEIDLSNPEKPELIFFSEADYAENPEEPWVDGNSPHLGGGCNVVLSEGEDVFDDKHNIILTKF